MCLKTCLLTSTLPFINSEAAAAQRERAATRREKHATERELAAELKVQAAADRE
jgi:hypothetical protein